MSRHNTCATRKKKKKKCYHLTFDTSVVTSWMELGRVHRYDEVSTAVQQGQVGATIHPISFARKPQSHLELRLMNAEGIGGEGGLQTPVLIYSTLDSIAFVFVNPDILLIK